MPPNNKKKKIKIKILVVKTSKTGVISLSKPCDNCLKKLNNVPGYIITHVYYTVNDGIIVKKLRDLLKEERHISKYFRRLNL